MSLQVWLPLNGNLDNHGLSNTTITSSGITVDNNGKIGKCYSSTNSGYINSGYGNGKVIDNLSICCWFKFNTIENNKIIFGSPNGNNQRCYLGYLSNNWCIAYGANSWSTGNGSSLGATAGVWQHLALVVENKVMSLYINGVKMGQTITLTTAPTAAGNIFALDYGAGTTYRPQGCMNDFRIYNHALSAKEIKEISKGLVLHYRLAGPGQENLAKDTFKVVTNSSYNIANYNLSTELVSGEKYTITMNGTCGAGKTNGFGVWLGGGYNNIGYFDLKDGQTGTKSFTFTMPASVSGDGRKDRINIYVVPSSVSVASTINWIKVEKGTNSTPWCPNTTDPLYGFLGYNNNIEYDCSGYRHNGTQSGAIIWDINSPRYTTSYKFGTTSSKIKTPTMDISGFTNSYTFSWWQYNTSTGNMPWGFSNGNRLNPYHATNLCWNTDDGGSNPFVPNITAASLQNAWHHITITGDGTDTKLYVDGVYKSKATTYKPLTGTQIYISGWDSGTSYTFNGSNLSDFRIYSTALSADDIAELYHTAVIVDNTGKSYAYEYFEAR